MFQMGKYIQRDSNSQQRSKVSLQVPNYKVFLTCSSTNWWKGVLHYRCTDRKHRALTNKWEQYKYVHNKKNTKYRIYRVTAFKMHG